MNWPAQWLSDQKHWASLMRGEQDRLRLIETYAWGLFISGAGKEAYDRLHIALGSGTPEGATDDQRHFWTTARKVWKADGITPEEAATLTDAQLLRYPMVGRLRLNGFRAYFPHWAATHNNSLLIPDDHHRGERKVSTGTEFYVAGRRYDAGTYIIERIGKPEPVEF